MSPRRQATADRPGKVGVPGEGAAEGTEAEQGTQRTLAPQAADQARAAEPAEKAGPAPALEPPVPAETSGLAETSVPAETSGASEPVRADGAGGRGRAAGGSSAGDRKASRAGRRKLRDAQAKQAGRPAAAAAAGTAVTGKGAGGTAVTGNGVGGKAGEAGQAGSAEPLPTRLPASQLHRAGQAQGGDEAAERPSAQQDTDLAADGAEISQLAPPALSARLLALARMIQIGSARSGRDAFSKKLLTDAEEVLGRAGERMRLSSSHTVIALAGGTGSGKSSLFNKLAGADFSTVGVTRPVTREAHACIWGATGSGALVDWLGIPARYRYARASALDRGEPDLAGLVLLDLPDHDSVMSHAGDMVDRLVTMADVLIWVLDPQKYADAAVHRRFLVPMAGHADVVAVVLNQADLLDGAQIDDCVTDLRRLLDSENLTEVPVLVTSAVTGAGMDDLRMLFVEAVAARVAATVRISADVDDVVSRFTGYAGPADAGRRVVPEGSVDLVAGRLDHAAGVAAVCDALRSARELRAGDFVGWPVIWLVQRLTGRGALRKVRLGMLWNDLRSVSTGPAGAQQAEVDNALTEFGDSLAASLPAPWSDTVRSAARSRADAIPAAVGAAIGDALPDEESVPWWWRMAGAWQGLLLGVGAVSIGWMALITVLGALHAWRGAPALFTDTGRLPWIAACAMVALGLGAATSSACMSLVRRSAELENGTVAADIKQRIAAVASDMVIMPAEQELSEFERFREEVRAAGG